VPTITLIEANTRRTGAAMEDQKRIWHEQGLRDAVLGGDEAAWRTLYEQCFDALYAYVYHRAGGNRTRTEDVVQECWLVAVRGMRRFDPARGSFEGWLRGVADNVLRNHRRRWKKHAADPGRSGELESTPDTAASNSDADLAEQIALAMTALPDRYQRALHAKYREQLAVAEIAERWDETPKAIESLLSRAREAFRREYRRLEEK
jgi:RNA polymerase sigma-70 factor (ECF subfamily)